MAEVLELERLQEALKEPPPSLTLPQALADAELTKAEIKSLGEKIIAGSKRWLPNVKIAVERARKHPDHPTRSGEAWAALEPLFSSALTMRENFVREIEEKIAEGTKIEHPLVDETVAYLERVLTQIRKEHRGLVEIYYLLKADAADADETTRGQGRRLSSSGDVKAHFRRFLSA